MDESCEKQLELFSRGPHTGYHIFWGPNGTEDPNSSIALNYLFLVQTTQNDSLKLDGMFSNQAMGHQNGWSGSTIRAQ